MNRLENSYEKYMIDDEGVCISEALWNFTRVYVCDESYKLQLNDTLYVSACVSDWTIIRKEATRVMYSTTCVTYDWRVIIDSIYVPMKLISSLLKIHEVTQDDLHVFFFFK